MTWGDMHAPVAALNSFRVQRAFYLYHSVHCTQWDSETVIWDVLDSKPCPGQVSDQNGLAQWATLSAVPCTSPAIMHRDAPAIANSSVKILLELRIHLLCSPTNLGMPVINEVMLSSEWKLLQMAGNTTVLQCPVSSYVFFFCLQLEGVSFGLTDIRMLHAPLLLCTLKIA